MENFAYLLWLYSILATLKIIQLKMKGGKR